MKFLLYTAVLMLPVCALAQTNTFNIQGKVTNYKPAEKVYLMYRTDSDEVKDSSEINNGTFTFSGNIPGPSSALLMFDRSGKGFENYIESNFEKGGPAATADARRLFLEAGTINITTTDSVKHATISGSKLNDEDKALSDQLAVFSRKYADIIKEANTTPEAERNSETFRATINNKLQVLQTEQLTTMKQFAKSHPDSFISLLLLINFAQVNPGDSELLVLFNSLTPSLQNTTTGIAIKTHLEAAGKTAIGSIAPEFSQADVSGNIIKLSSYRGKYVLVDFWASWCGPCRQENPNVVAAYNKYKTKNFTVLGVSLDKNKSAWVNAIAADNLAWTQVSDLKYWQNEAAALYGVKSIPQNFLIAPDGKMIAKNLRGAELDARLEELLR